MGFAYLETDVHLSADGVVVAAHDERLDRVSDTDGAIAGMTWREISRARLAGSEPIPTLEELLDAFPDSRFNIDAKSDAVVDPLMDLLVRRDALDRVAVGGFSQDRLIRMRNRLGGGLCSAAGPREVAALVARARVGATQRTAQVDFGCIQVPVTHRGLTLVTPRLVDFAHRIGVQVHVWTIDDPSEMHRLLDLGVDGLMTDRPSVLREVLVDRGSWSPAREEFRHREHPPA